MKKKHRIKKILLTGALASLGTIAIAEITVNKSNGMLTITSDINGTVIAKVVGPDDEVMADESYSGSTFSWAPSSGPDGAYRYDVRVLPQVLNESNDAEALSEDNSITTNKSDYAGGSVEVKNGQIDTSVEEIQ